MINFQDVTEEKIKHKSNWLQVFDQPYRLIILGGSVSKKNKFIV